jgi:hypothetical protein
LVLTEQFLPVRAVLLEDYWRKTAEKWHFAEVGYSSASNNFGGFYNASRPVNIRGNFCIVAVLIVADDCL